MPKKTTPRPAAKAAKKTGSRKAPPRTIASAEVPVDPRFTAIADGYTTDRAVTFGKMMAAPGLKVDGKIFAMLPRGEFVVKLPRPRVDALVAGGRGHHFDPGHGRLMKEWVVVTDPKADWTALAKEAYVFVKSGH